jgi:very-short-patch-repair endonuclease
MSDTPLDGAYARLRDDIVEHVTSELSWMPDEACGDSPIEKIFYTALWASCRFGMSALDRVMIPSRNFPLDRLLASEDQSILIVQPQAQLEGWRVDFLIYAWETGRISGKPQWRRLIVECDGHDFHERTKEQAAKDRSRDREFQLRGYAILRFTGSELYAKPLACALQVGEWAEMGW